MAQVLAASFQQLPAASQFQVCEVSGVTAEQRSTCLGAWLPAGPTRAPGRQRQDGAVCVGKAPGFPSHCGPLTWPHRAEPLDSRAPYLFYCFLLS